MRLSKTAMFVSLFIIAGFIVGLWLGRFIGYDAGKMAERARVESEKPKTYPALVECSRCQRLNEIAQLERMLTL